MCVFTGKVSEVVNGKITTFEQNIAETKITGVYSCVLFGLRDFCSDDFIYDIYVSSKIA